MAGSSDWCYLETRFESSGLRDDQKNKVFPRDTEEMVWSLLQPGMTGMRTSLTDKTQQAGTNGRMLFHYASFIHLSFLCSKLSTV